MRLDQLRKELGLSFAEMNERLGRNRRDATLSQVAQQQPNSRTGKVRQIGDEQARLLETKFDKPTGWMDRDPEFDAIQARLAELLRAPAPAHSEWPFRRVDVRRVRALSPDAFAAIEDTLIGAVEMAERLSQRAA